MANAISVQLRRKVPGITQRGLAQFASQACSAARIRREIGVRVSSDEEIRAMNLRFRGRNKTTDVLSFPSELPGYAGDILISAEVAAANARRLGHTVADEIKVLLLHGLLHLAGYDHERDSGEMAELEKNLRRRLRLPTTLTERAQLVQKNSVALR
jgi:probable rRNA maturation factor